MKRAFDLFFSLLGLILLGPLLLLIALAIKITDPGPVFFKQQRVGLGGKPFHIWKFRTMVVNAEKMGLSITAGVDARITRIGRFLRKWKLDELPQLWNVFCGQMTFVGPRPEVPRYVEKYTVDQRKVLALKPGITDMATLEFRDEESLLQSVPDPEKFYIEYCIGRKIELNLAYAKSANLWEDIKIILRTLIPKTQSAKITRP